jgi:Helix-turn-helix domain
MAIECMVWVLRNSRSKLAGRLVLLAIADSAHPDGAGAWPSVADIAERANVSTSSVRTAIKDLVELGELEVDYNGGARGPNGVTNSYRVVMRDYPPKATQRNRRRPDTPSDSAGVQSLEGSKVLTPAESAPLKTLAEGVQDLALRGPDSGGGTVLEPPRTKTSGAPAADPACRPGSVHPAQSAAAAARPKGTTGRYPETAQGLVSWWIDLVRAKTGNPEYAPPGKVLGHASRLLREMLAEGVPFAAVRRGLWLWIESDKTSSPAVIPSIVNDVMSGTVTPMHQDRPNRAGQGAGVAPPADESEMIL